MLATRSACVVGRRDAPLPPNPDFVPSAAVAKLTGRTLADGDSVSVVIDLIFGMVNTLV